MIVAVVDVSNYLWCFVAVFVVCSVCLIVVLYCERIHGEKGLVALLFAGFVKCSLSAVFCCLPVRVCRLYVVMVTLPKHSKFFACFFFFFFLICFSCS